LCQRTVNNDFEIDLFDTELSVHLSTLIVAKGLPKKKIANIFWEGKYLVYPMVMIYLFGVP
jgi:hypothetical protein